MRITYARAWALPATFRYNNVLAGLMKTRHPHRRLQLQVWQPYCLQASLRQLSLKARWPLQAR